MIAEVAIPRVRPSRRWWLVVSLALHVAVIAALAAQPPARLAASQRAVAPPATRVDLRRVPAVPRPASQQRRCGDVRSAVRPGTPARLSGEIAISPSEATRQAMVTAGRHGVTAAFEYCLAPRGVVRSVTLTKSSGYAEYDARLEQAIWRWSYARNAGVCARVAIIFTLCD